MLRAMKTMVIAVGLALSLVPAHAAVRYGYVVAAPVYRPWGFGPYWGGGPYYGGMYVPPAHPHSGQVKFDTKEKTAQVFIDGAFAGTVKDVNSAWLREGSHNVRVLHGDGTRFESRIYVLAGKSTHIHPDLLKAPNS
jgi:hypothetical protein